MVNIIFGGDLKDFDVVALNVDLKSNIINVEATKITSEMYAGDWIDVSEKIIKFTIPLKKVKL